jgi:UDP-3-O-[3-hydroxymyristoyl] glucosamine N-acyltransferase
MKLKDLAALIGGEVSGNADTEITGVSGIDDAKEGDITFLSIRKNIGKISSTQASAVILKEEIRESIINENNVNISMLVVKNPEFSYAKALEVFYVKPYAPVGISDRAIIGNNVTLGDDLSIYPLAHICNNVTLGSRVTVSSGAYIGDGVSIDNDSFISPNVVLGENTVIGSKVIINPGAVIGSEGFGFALEKGAHYKIPQTGGVVIEDNVEIGANVTIDKATLGNTIIGSGTKIDNLVQIGHNVKIGKNCIIVSQVGISGSVEIGDGVVLAGQVGVRDHVKIGNRAIVGAQGGIGSDIPEGQIYSGSPAIPHKTWLRAQSIFSKLPGYVKRIQEVERKLQKEEKSDVE